MLHIETHDGTVGRYNREVVLECLRSLGITRVVIEFDGCGDDGQIQDVVFEGLVKDTNEIDVDVVLKNIRTHFKDNEWFHEVEEKQYKSLRNLVETYAYDTLQNSNYDWVNNDGGFGQIIIEPFEVSELTERPGTIKCEMNIRYTDATLYELDF